MKLVTAIIRDTDNEAISQALTSAGFGVTCIASTGGFLRHGQKTLLIGLEDHQVQTALDIIRKNCTQPSESDSRKSIIFVINIVEHTKF